MSTIAFSPDLLRTSFGHQPKKFEQGPRELRRRSDKNLVESKVNPKLLLY